jgi:hypothetical protein
MPAKALIRAAEPLKAPPGSFDTAGKLSIELAGSSGF